MNKATFIVQVQFAQNASWQGTVTWTEQKKETHFRSALELLKLMNEAVSVGQIDEENPSQWE